MAQRVALVTGANKGLGYFISKRLAMNVPNCHVILTARNVDLGRKAVDQLVKEGVPSSSLSFLPLDVSEKDMIDQLSYQVQCDYGGLDILVNNAGIAFDGDVLQCNVLNPEIAETTLKTNFYGVLNASKAFIPLINPGGRVVNMAGRAGLMTKLKPEIRASFKKEDITEEELMGLMQRFVQEVQSGTHLQSGFPNSAYAMSKIGVAALTHIFARDTTTPDVLVNAVCPGMCRTDMMHNSPKAPFTAEQGSEATFFVATLPQGSPTGQYYWDKKPHPWNV